MKKILAILLASICAFSVATLVACGKEQSDSDVVTKEEWETAFSNTNAAYNVSITKSVQWYHSDSDSDEKKLVAEENYVTKLESSEGSYGKEYYYFDTSYYRIDGTTQGAISTDYIDYGTSSYSYVATYLTKLTGDKDYFGRSNSSTSDFPTANLFNIENMVLRFNYDLYEYKDGAYVYTYEYQNAGVGPYIGVCLSAEGVCELLKVKINDGYVTSIEAEGVILVMDIDSINKLAENSKQLYYEYFDYLNVSDVRMNTFKYELKLSDYGSTKVDIPEEYTYEYYSEHSQD